MSRTNSDKQYAKALSLVFIIHMVMFVVSFTAAIIAGSSSVLADSLDFIGDAASYALSLYILTKGVFLRAVLSIAKAVTMLSFGVPVMIYALSEYSTGTPPNYEIMGMAGGLGICAHIVCVFYLYKFRSGDSNRLSVWICTINDLISNLITLFASYLVLITNSIIPDITAAIIIIMIAFYGAIIILKQAIKEIKSHQTKVGVNTNNV